LQLGAWELRYALLNAQNILSTEPSSPAAARASKDRGSEPATGQAVQALLVHWQEALEAIGFLDPNHPKKLMPRMRHLFNRGDLTQDEVDMWRGVCTAMIATARGIRHNNPLR
jgi:tRNA/rRNA methyltransferase